MSRLRLLWVAMFALALAAIPRGVSPAHADGCRFILGFATLHDLLPRVVGQCVDDEQHNPTNGNGLQHTSGRAGAGGLLVWRKADNWTAFTDGYRTWVNGPTGLEYRLNTQRFAWEANPDGLPIIPDAHVGASQFALSGAKLRVTDSTFGRERGPLIFHIAGTGFAIGETVTLEGTYTPAYLVAGIRQACDPVALGPTQVRAGGTGSFTATLQGATDLLQGGDLSIIATGNAGSHTTLGGGGSLPQVDTLPAGCGV